MKPFFLILGTLLSFELRAQTFTIEQTDVTAPRQWLADIDEDGSYETIDVKRYALGSDGVYITFSESGRSYHIQLSEQPPSNVHDLELEVIGNGSETIILVAHTYSEGLHRNQHDQLYISFDENLEPSLHSTNIRAAGRSVSCASYDANDTDYCFYADYIGYSKLIKLRKNSQPEFVDVTTASQIPFPVTRQPTRLYGRYTIGSAFVDFNQDNKLDLVSVAQHAYPIASQFEEWVDDIPVFHSSYIGRTGEYMRVYSPYRVASHIPCVYMAMEKSESEYPDHFSCFDNTTGTWNIQELPGEYFNEYSGVEFTFLAPKLYFKARQRDGRWDLLSYQP